MPIERDIIKTRTSRKKRVTEKLVKLIKLIREHSTIIPFRWSYNKYSCFYCGDHFLECEKLKRHTKEEHSGVISDNTLKSLLKKVKVKLDISEIACTKCPKTIKSFQEFLDHVVYAHDVKYDSDVTQFFSTFNLSDDGMTCIICGAKFVFFKPLLNHFHNYHNYDNNKHVCEYCSLAFVTKLNLTNHVKNVHMGENSTKCIKCGETFRSRHSMDKHAITVHKTFYLKCPKCPEVLSSRYMKKRHLALEHGEKSSQFACKLCPLVFLTRSTLSRHNLRVHLKEKRFTCDTCGYKSFDKDSLQIHMSIHNDLRPFECEFCKKCFQRKKTLDYHRRTHTNDKRYVCSECGKAFVQSTSLKLHLRVHHSIVKNRPKK